MFGSTGSRPRRDEHARRVLAHLVHVVNQLRMPDVLEASGGARLRQREDIPVAIVVMADVMVIDLWRRGSVIWSAARLSVPLRYYVHSIRIFGRFEQDDDVVENRLEFRVIVFRQQPVSEFHGGVR